MSIRLNFCRSVPPEFLRSFLSLSVRVMHPGATLATNSSFHLTGERREDMILNQNISTIHVLCVGCTVQPARPFFSARRSQLQAGWIQPWWGDRREGAGGWLGGCCCSSCKVPFFHTGKGRSHPTTCLNMDKAVRLDAGPRWQTCSPDFCDRGAGAHWAHRSTVPLGLDFVLPYRRHDLGDLVVRRAGLPASPGSRLFGHVTKILVT